MRRSIRTIAKIEKPPGARPAKAPARPGRGAVGTLAIEPPEHGVRQALTIGGRTVQLSNLAKPFWPDLGITKGDLLQYYADVSPLLLPHLRDRAMVMKRYPNGVDGPFFFMKRAPVPRPEWIQTCAIHHSSGSVIDFPMIQDLPSLLWVINLGCIDLNPWYARCDDVNRPDCLYFDLDPSPGADFNNVCEAALIVRDALRALEMPCFAKTTGSRGIHIAIPIVRGLLQKEVWAYSKELARHLESLHPKLITAEYRVHKRPPGHVLIDYNQNAWGRTLAGIYSVRPRPEASVSTPVEWTEIEKGIRIEDFRLDNVRARFPKTGDLWKPILAKRGRFRLDRLLARPASNIKPAQRPARGSSNHA